jgi:hypothetical protein
MQSITTNLIYAPVGTFTGPDNRPVYGRTDNAVRINDNVSNAIVLTNTNQGYFYSTTVKLEYPYQKVVLLLLTRIQMLMICCLLVLSLQVLGQELDQ